MKDYLVIIIIAVLTLILCLNAIYQRVIDIRAVLIPTPNDWLLILKGHCGLCPLNMTLESKGLLRVLAEIPKGDFTAIIENGVLTIGLGNIKVYQAFFNYTHPIQTPSKLPLLINASGVMTLNTTLTVMPGDVIAWVRLDERIYIRAFYNCIISRICIDGNCSSVNTTRIFVNESHVVVYLRCPGGTAVRLIECSRRLA